MAFGHSTQRDETATRFENPYLNLKEGERVIRVLDREERSYWRYFIDVNVGGKKSGRPIVVGGGENPIRRYMDKLGKEHQDYRAPQKRMLLNVLDRTPVKLNKFGSPVYAGMDGRTFPSVDPATSEAIVNAPVAPHNKVLLMDFGNELMQALMVIHERIRHNQTFEPLPIWALDIKIITKGTGKDTKRMAMPDMNQEPLPAELAALPKFDLALAVRVMPDVCQERLLNGEDYNVIMKELGWERLTPTVAQ